MSELDPTPELPDDTPIDRVHLPTRTRNVLNAAGLKTVGEVRETSDDILLSLQDFGTGSVAYLRETLGLRSADGLRPTMGSETKGAEMSRQNQKWTPEEDRRLLELRASGRSLAVIAKELNRTEAAVDNRVYTLKNRADPALRGPYDQA